MPQNKNTVEEIGSSRELYNFLYEACNILRGPVSQDAFKEYITPLLYFKRISDVYDEESQAALEMSDGDEEFASLPEQHRNTSGAYQGAKYFSYNGKVLDEIRRERECIE